MHALSTALVWYMIIRANWTKPLNITVKHWVYTKELKGRSHLNVLELSTTLVMCIKSRINWVRPSHTTADLWESTKMWKERNQSNTLQLSTAFMKCRKCSINDLIGISPLIYLIYKIFPDNCPFSKLSRRVFK